MSTRSNIVLLRENGSCSAVYCHYDGYLEHNGRILLDNYTSTKDVRALVAMGNIRSLKTMRRHHIIVIPSVVTCRRSILFL
jgi:hypothetical protein